MSNLAKCPKCWEMEILQWVDLEEWEEYWLIKKEEWNYEELCVDCMQDIQIKNERLRLGI